jgi:small conductance mechanosensitive channel
MDIQTIKDTVLVQGTNLALKILGAIALWIVGRALINFAVNTFKRAFQKKLPDQTLINFAASTISITLNIILIVAILGFFGIQTTSFAALLAGVGLAVGAAWSGLLGNFAAGAFLLIFRPFKNGDFVTAGGITGTVEEIGLFVTTIKTPDNIRTFVGNGKISGDIIQNFTANPFRRVDRLAQLNANVDPAQAIALLKERISKIPNVLTDPAPDVEILDFTAFGPLLAVRPYCKNEHYWQVYFDTNRVIRDAFGEAGFPAPEQRLLIRNAT